MIRQSLLTTLSQSKYVFSRVLCNAGFNSTLFSFLFCFVVTKQPTVGDRINIEHIIINQVIRFRRRSSAVAAWSNAFVSDWACSLSTTTTTLYISRSWPKKNKRRPKNLSTRNKKKSYLHLPGPVLAIGREVFFSFKFLCFYNDFINNKVFPSKVVFVVKFFCIRSLVDVFVFLSFLFRV